MKMNALKNLILASDLMPYVIGTIDDDTYASMTEVAHELGETTFDSPERSAVAPDCETHFVILGDTSKLTWFERECLSYVDISFNVIEASTIGM